MLRVSGSAAHRYRWVRRSAVGAALVLGMGVMPLAGTAWAADPCSAPDSNRVVTCSYAFTGSEQTFTVPSGVTEVQVVAVGGAGGVSVDDGNPSRGARASGTLTGFVAGQVLYVEVGGAATGGGTCAEFVTCNGGFNGGGSNQLEAGGGGGASDVRSQSRVLAGSLESRLVVAAGGGGEGGGAYNCATAVAPGGNGGDGGAAGGAGQVCPGVTAASTGGGAGTDNAGGVGGTSSVDGQVQDTGTAGTSGTGAGSAFTLGGAGGGGLFGGGSGASKAIIPANGKDAVSAGGGGGGSSLVPAGGSVSVTGGPTSVTISYTVPVDETASAQLTALGTAVQGVGPGKSLANKVSTAQSRLAAGDTAGACSALTGFVNEVTAQSGKKIPTATADQLLADASRIRAVIGC